MKIHPITLTIVILIVTMIAIFAFVVIRNSNQVINHNIRARRAKESKKLNLQDVDDTEKIAIIVSTLYKMFENRKHEYKKGLVAVKKGHYAKYEIFSKESTQWKNKSDEEYKPKHIEYIN